jgi:hypothetical protein
MLQMKFAIMVLTVLCSRLSPSLGLVRLPSTRQSLMVRNFWPFDKAAAPTGVAIIDAIETQNEDSVKSVLSNSGSNKSIINERDPATGNNAMHIIAKKGHYKYPPANIPKTLVAGGIDINAKNLKGESPLEISLLSGWQVTQCHLCGYDSVADQSTFCI